MDENDFSCIKQVTETVQLTMPLKYTSNEIAGVTEILDGWKRQYVPKLQGVVVNYKDIRLTRRPFFIHISRTAPRYDVTATFDMFCPSIGDIVKGTINRTSREHIGCLIEGTINATIHLPHNSSQNLSKFIHINRDILFQINRFEFNRHTIRVNGEITPECVKLMEQLFDYKDYEENLSNGLTNCVSISKKRKRDSESPNFNSPETSKKKRKKHLENETIDAMEHETSALNSDLVSNELTADDFESKFAALDSHSLLDTLQTIKTEAVSSANSDASENLHKSKDSKKKSKSKHKDKSKSKNKDKSKLKNKDKSKSKKKDKSKSKNKDKSKSKSKIVAAGDILKNDKKRSKSKKKNKSDKNIDNDVKPVSIKSELN